MTIFTDDFERANGALGNNWTVVQGVFAISNGTATYSGNGQAWNSTVSDDHFLEAKARVTWVDRTKVSPAVVVCMDGSTQIGFALRITLSAGVYTVAIGLGGTAWGSALVSDTLDSTPAPYFELRLTWENGYLKGYIDGVLVIEGESGLYSGGHYCGMSGYGAAGVYTEFTAVSGSSVDLSADPSVIGNYGTCTDIQLTGVNTDWVAGTPGSPVFTVNHGYISSQTVIDANHAVITYCPGSYLGSVQLCDPSSTYCIGLLVTSDPAVVPPTGYTFSAEAIEYIERSAVAQLDPTILNQDANPWDYDGTETVPDVLRRVWHLLTGLSTSEEPSTPSTQSLADLYARLWGGEEWQSLSFTPPGTNSVKAALDGVLHAPLPLKTENVQQLQDVIDSLKTGYGMTLQALYNVIGITDQSQYGSIRAYLEAAAIDNAQFWIDWIQRWQDYLSEEGYSLATVKGWIDALQGDGDGSIEAILSLLQAIRGDNNATLHATQDYAINADNHSSNNYDVLWDVTAHRTQTFQTIIDMIRGLDERTITEVFDKLDTIGGGGQVDLSAVINLINEIRGDDTTTLKQILESINASGSGTDWSVPALLLLGLLALLGLPELAGALVIAGGKLTPDLIVDIISTILDAASFFLDLWNALHQQPQGTTANVPPAYPGAAGVTFLDAIPFDGGINITLDMDGALIDISVPGEHPYAIKNTTPIRYGRLGTYAFAADVGRLESIQPVQYLTMVATPHSIIHPTGLVVQCKPGTVGTVTPYRLNG